MSHRRGEYLVESPDTTDEIISSPSNYVCPKKERCPWIRLQLVDYQIKTCMLRSEIYEERAITLRKQLETFAKLPQCVNEAQRKLFVEQHRAFSQKLNRHDDMVNWMQDCVVELIERQRRLIDRADNHGFCIGFDATRDEESPRCGSNCTVVQHMRFLSGNS